MKFKDKLNKITKKLNIFDKIKLLMLFGSRARGDNSENSDVDIAILLDDNYFEEINPLELRSELMVYYSDHLNNECDVILINEANSLLKYQIVKYGEIIYISDKLGYSTFYSKIVREHFDFRYYKNLHYDRMMERIVKGGDSDGR